MNSKKSYLHYGLCYFDARKGVKVRDFCISCGAPLGKGKTFCGDCGTKAVVDESAAKKEQDNETTEEIPVQESPQNVSVNKKCGLILGIISGAVLIGAVVFLLVLTGVFENSNGDKNCIQNLKHIENIEVVITEPSNRSVVQPAMKPTGQPQQTQVLENQIIGFWQIVALHLDWEVDYVAEYGYGMEFLADGRMILYEGFAEAHSYEWYEMGDGRIQIDSEDDVFTMGVTFSSTDKEDSMNAAVTHLGDNDEQVGNFIKVEKNAFVMMADIVSNQEQYVDTGIIFGKWYEKDGQDYTLEFLQDGSVVYTSDDEATGVYAYNNDTGIGIIIIEGEACEFYYNEDDNTLWFPDADLWFMPTRP